MTPPPPRRVRRSHAAGRADGHAESALPTPRVPHLDPVVPAAEHTGPAEPGHPHPVPLADRQAALVAALVAGAPDPPGFDPARLAATRRALLRKRAGAAARVWPRLAASLGAGWPRVFSAHRSGREPVGALRDGWDVARALHELGELAAGAAAELAEREASMRYDGRSAPRPRTVARARRRVARWLGR